VVESGILPVMAQILRRKSTLTTHTARLVAELARDGKNMFYVYCFCVNKHVYVNVFII